MKFRFFFPKIFSPPFIREKTDYIFIFVWYPVLSMWTMVLSVHCTPSFSTFPVDPRPGSHGGKRCTQPLVLFIFVHDLYFLQDVKYR